MTWIKLFNRKLSSLAKDEDGPTAVEYAVMLSLIVSVCIAAIEALGGSASTIFSSVFANSSGSSAVSEPTFAGGAPVGVGTYMTSNYNGTGQSATFYNTGPQSVLVNSNGLVSTFTLNSSNSSMIPGNPGTTWTQTSTTSNPP